jgi:2-keto-4-pentenoate hydratase/2-oxohepta-3-ene-1,7-dioic acid hydratase in catechol pathway
MRIASIRTDHGPRPAVIDPRRGVALVADIAPRLTGDLMALLDPESTGELAELAQAAPDSAFRPEDSVRFDAPYRSPRKIWGIGLNYRDHARDLKAPLPDEPASFIKGDHTIVGPGEDIVLPEQSTQVTAEAELALIIGRYCRNVCEEEALDYVWGVVPTLDQTAEDLILRNPRFLTRSKNFPTFLSFGPAVVQMSEVRETFGTLDDIEVRTVRNGVVQRADVVRGMAFSPAFLVSFHSKVMPLYPGDILSPGTPGAVRIEDGDVVRCEIPGIGVLENPVRRPPATDPGRA